MGLFNIWRDALHEALNSAGQDATPVDTAEKEQDAASIFAKNPQNAQKIGDMTASAGSPTKLRQIAINLGTQAARGFRGDNLNAAGIAGRLLTNTVPDAPNPFKSALRPIKPIV